jgi:hypothetical protein
MWLLAIGGWILGAALLSLLDWENSDIPFLIRIPLKMIELIFEIF